VAKCATPPGGCSLYPRGTERFQHLNLQTLAFELTSSQKWSSITSWALFAILVGISVYLIRRHVTDSNESAGIAIISVLTLLPFYQNTYSAQILLFVLYWAVENWPAKSAKAAVLCMLPLLVPPLWALARVVGPFIRFIQDHNLSSNLIWNCFVMLNVIWIELVLLLLVFAHLYKVSTNQSTAFDN
jgi:hypothetical protein